MSNSENNNYEYNDSNYNIIYSNNESLSENVSETIKKTINHIEYNISFYNEQKKLLKNLYKNLLDKNKNIKKIENSKLSLIEKIEKNYGPIVRSRGKAIYNKELEFKNTTIKSLKNEQNKLVNLIKNIIENNNLNIILSKNNINTNSLKIKLNNFISKIKDLTNILTKKIKKINDKIEQIKTILTSNSLNKTTIDKTSISMIYDLDEFVKDIIGKNNLSTILFQNINLLNSSINEKYKKSKEYKEFQKNYNTYTELLTKNNELIINTLQKSLQKRDEYRLKIDTLINDITFLMFNNNQTQNKKNRMKSIMTQINRIKDYKCIELNELVLDTIYRLNNELMNL
jgi:hypothetical protein